MDVLSDVIASLRTGRAHYARTTRTTPWAISHSRFAGAGFHLVLQGSCWLRTPDAEPIALGPGDLIFLPTGSEHLLTSDRTSPATSALAVALTDVGSADDNAADEAGNPTVMLCGAYLMDQAASHPMLAELPRTVLIRSRAGQHTAVRATVGLLADELDERRLGADTIVPALLDALLLYVLRTWFTQQSGHRAATGWAAAFADPAIGSALRGMHADCAHPWTIAELSAAAGLSRATFSRRFAALIGQPPLTYLTWWRMTVAARLLSESDRTMAAVAAATGYTSEFAFSHAFKRAYDLPPGRYRHGKRSPE